MVKIDKGDGIGLCYVLMHIHTLNSQARQNALLKELDDGEDALRTGNPGAKIRESLRPALETLNEMQMQDPRSAGPYSRCAEQRRMPRHARGVALRFPTPLGYRGRRKVTCSLVTPNTHT